MKDNVDSYKTPVKIGGKGRTLRSSTLPREVESCFVSLILLRFFVLLLKYKYLGKNSVMAKCHIACRTLVSNLPPLQWALRLLNCRETHALHLSPIRSFAGVEHNPSLLELRF